MADETTHEPTPEEISEQKAVRLAKRELTDRSSTIVQIDHLTVQPNAPRAITVPIRRSRVEELWSPLVDHTIAIVEQMLTRVNVAPSEIQEVLLHAAVYCGIPTAVEAFRTAAEVVPVDGL